MSDIHLSPQENMEVYNSRFYKSLKCAKIKFIPALFHLLLQDCIPSLCRNQPGKKLSLTIQTSGQCICLELE